METSVKRVVSNAATLMAPRTFATRVALEADALLAENHLVAS